MFFAELVTALRRLLLRLWSVLRSGSADREMDREIASHLTLLEEDLRRRGLSVEAARIEARRSFGRLDQIKDAHRDARSMMWLEDLGRDLQYARRTLLRSPIFSLAAVLTLGVAIGGATAVVSLFGAVLLQPLPFPDSHRLVLLFRGPASRGTRYGRVLTPRGRLTIRSSSRLPQLQGRAVCSTGAANPNGSMHAE
jgi:putative ABC transport system permease protein